MTKANTTRTLVLMRCGDEDERTVFAGDLYSGPIFEGSVYHDRASMLDWLGPISIETRSAVAHALDLLATLSDLPMRSVSLDTLPGAGPYVLGKAPSTNAPEP